jgi:effector-binding domain-containing protein
MDLTIVTLEPRPALAIRETFPARELGDKFGEIYREIGVYMKANSVNMTGPPFGIYHSYSADSVDLEAGYPADSIPPEGSRIHSISTYGGKAAMTEFRGHYDGLSAAWKEFAELVDNAGYKLAGPCFEVYITDPFKEPDTHKWITELYTPII